MAKVDKFISALFQVGGDELRFVTGRPVVIKDGTIERVALDQEVRSDQIDKLLSAVISDSELSRFLQPGDGTFSYESPDGPVDILVRRRSDRLMVTIRRSVWGDAVPTEASGEQLMFGSNAAEQLGTMPAATEGETLSSPSPPPPRSPSKLQLHSFQERAPGARVARGVPDLPPMREQRSPRARLGNGSDPDVVLTPRVPGPGVAPRPDATDGALAFDFEHTPVPSDSAQEVNGVQVGKSPSAVPPRARDPSRPKDEISIAISPAPLSVGGIAAVDKILLQLVRAGASDLHLTAGQRPKMRRDGDIQDVPGWDVQSGGTILEWMSEVASPRVREQFEQHHDVDYSYEIPDVARFRMNLFLDRLGAGAVVRTIPSRILTPEELGLPPVVKSFCALPRGLVCVTGPTGAGKSTTLAALIDSMNRTRADHIITIEDPIEFVHNSLRCLVNQREVYTHTESFARALLAALREDPDVVLVGELRDLETVQLALETAEVGHLVFGALPSSTAVATVDRIIDQFPAERQAQVRVMLSECLRGVVSQTLCKKIGGGRVPCLEILVVNHAIAGLIREGKTSQIPVLMQAGRAHGMQTQVDAMLELVRANRITALEAYGKAVDQGQMRTVLERNGYRVEAK